MAVSRLHRLREELPPMTDMLDMYDKDPPSPSWTRENVVSRYKTHVQIARDKNSDVVGKPWVSFRISPYYCLSFNILFFTCRLLYQGNY